MKLRMAMVAACAVFVIPVFAQTEGTYLIRYVNTGSAVNITNTGSSIGLPSSLFALPKASSPFGPASFNSDGNICANVYVLTPDEQLQECCSCFVTPNALKSYTYADLTGNTLTGVSPTSVVVKIVASWAIVPDKDLNFNFTSTCTPAGPAGPFGFGTQTTASTVGQLNSRGLLTGPPLSTGAAAWAVTPHGAATTETPFTVGQLSQTSPRGDSELKRLTGLCQNIIDNGSGRGICAVCHLGSL
jgi:hypothetical protein